MKKKDKKTLYWIGLLVIAGVIYWKWKEKQNGDDEAMDTTGVNGSLDYSSLA